MMTEGVVRASPSISSTAPPGGRDLVITLDEGLDDSTPLKPVKVDNWGIYLLQRLHSFYTKGERTDLLLRFLNHKEESIHLHRLVFEASSNWLNTIHDEQVAKGIIDMPPNLTPEAVKPVVTFMYTGKLITGNANYDKIKETAELLRMSVLIKLIDDAKTRTSQTDTLSSLSINRGEALDPVRQIHRIKSIEKKFADNEKRSKILAAKAKERQIEEQNRIPGKKLPIWKKRANPPSLESIEDHKEGEYSDTMKSSHSVNDKASLIEDDKIEYVHVPSVNYKRKSSNSQEGGLFDQVRETPCSKKGKHSIESDDDPKRGEVNKAQDDSGSNIDENMKELLEEQRKRLTLQGSEYEDDDYGCGDNDEYYLGEDDPLDIGERGSPVAKQSVPAKVVRFSLTPSSNSVTSLNNKDPDCDLFNETSSSTAPSDSSLDLPQYSPLQLVPSATLDSNSCSKSTEPTSSKPDTAIIVISDSSDKKRVISEVVRKNPGLLKNYRQIKLKIMTKNNDGKPGVRYVTLRPPDTPLNIPQPIKNPPEKRPSVAKRLHMISTINGDFKQSPKVMYTGRRGRPKKIKEGDFDPHEQNRQEINQRLTENRFYGHKLKCSDTWSNKNPNHQILPTNAASEPHPPITAESPQIQSSSHSQQPSSEAEAMSKVASDIAASINLVPPDFAEGSPGAYIEAHPNLEQHQDSPKVQKPMPFSKNEEGGKDNPSERMDKVSSLVLEWDEVDETEEQLKKKC